MLVKIILESWKSIEDATLHFDTLAVLIGTNASGKSNVLDALSFLQRSASGLLLTSALQGDAVAMPMRGGLEWAARKPGSTFALSTIVSNLDGSVEYEYCIKCQVAKGQCELISESLIRRKYRLSPKGARYKNPAQVNLFRTDDISSDTPTIVSRLYNGKQGSPRQFSRASSILFQLVGQKSSLDVSEGVHAVVEAHKSIFILDPIPSHMREYSSFSETLLPDASNIAGVMAAMPDPQKQSVEATLTKYVAKLPERDIIRVFSEPVGRFNSDAMLYCEEGFSKPPMVLDARGMSDGTLRFLAILVALLTRPRSSLLVVEEVDNGLHPSRSKVLLDVLKNVGSDQGVDVLVTTHNPALLDVMGTEMIPFITVAHRNVRNGATELTLLEDVGTLPQLLAVGTVGKLSSEGRIEESLNVRQGGLNG